MSFLEHSVSCHFSNMRQWAKKRPVRSGINKGAGFPAPCFLGLMLQILSLTQDGLPSLTGAFSAFLWLLPSLSGFEFGFEFELIACCGGNSFVATR